MLLTSINAYSKTLTTSKEHLKNNLKSFMVNSITKKGVPKITLISYLRV